MRHGSLFSGGGGFDLAAEIMGWQNVFHCEKDPFCRTILNHYWPEAAAFDDIKTFNAQAYQGKIDIITGGFPCQPFSYAGQRRGTGDDRYLWPDMLRVIQQIRPRWVVGENVYGLVNWSEGLVFDQVQSDLEAEGYEVTAFVLPAAGLNAPHQRYRVWIVGYHPEYAATGQAETDSDPNRFRRRVTKAGGKTSERRHARRYRKIDGLYPAQLAEIDPDPNGAGLEGRAQSRRPKTRRKETIQHLAGFYQYNAWQDWPTQSPLCRGDDGLSARLDGISFSKWKTHSIKMYGNAIVPQMAVRIFEAIRAHDALYSQPEFS